MRCMNVNEAMCAEAELHEQSILSAYRWGKMV